MGSSPTSFSDNITLLAEANVVNQDKPLVILVDALDEIDPSDLNLWNISNPLELPRKELPPGFYIACSARVASKNKVEESIGGLKEAPLADERHALDSGEAQIQHQKALKKYAVRECKNIEYIRSGQLSAEDIASILCEKSGYNFMIVRSALYDVNGWINNDILVNLTSDLKDRFKNYFRRMSRNDVMGEYARTVLCLAFKPQITIRNFMLLATLGKDTSNSVVGGLLSEWQSQGLVTTYIDSQSKTHWISAFHKSFKEYLYESLTARDKSIFLKPYYDALNPDGLDEELQKLSTEDRSVFADWLELMLSITRELDNCSKWKILFTEPDIIELIKSDNEYLKSILRLTSEMSFPNESRPNWEETIRFVAKNLLNSYKENTITLTDIAAGIYNMSSPDERFIDLPKAILEEFAND